MGRRRGVYIRSAKVKVRQCPVCRATLDGVTCVSRQRQGDGLPQPGDLTVCVYCQTWLVFTAAGLGLREATVGEVESLDPFLRNPMEAFRVNLRQRSRSSTDWEWTTWTGPKKK